MSDLANVNAPAGIRPPHVPYRGPVIEGTAGSCDVPVVRSTVLDPVTLERPRGHERPQCYGATYARGMLDPWPANTGNHGVIPGYLPPPDMTGGQQAWRSWNPRTFRHEPTRPWDAGSEVT